jgi:hypothetical protein
VDQRRLGWLALALLLAAGALASRRLGAREIDLRVSPLPEASLVMVPAAANAETDLEAL